MHIHVYIIGVGAGPAGPVLAGPLFRQARNIFSSAKATLWNEEISHSVTSSDMYLRGLRRYMHANDSQAAHRCFAHACVVRGWWVSVLLWYMGLVRPSVYTTPNKSVRRTTPTSAPTPLSRLACIPISIVYLAINRRTHALFLLWQNVRANDTGSRPLLSDAIMAFSTINQPRVDF